MNFFRSKWQRKFLVWIALFMLTIIVGFFIYLCESVQTEKGIVPSKKIPLKLSIKYNSAEDILIVSLFNSSARGIVMLTDTITKTRFTYLFWAGEKCEDGGFTSEFRSDEINVSTAPREKLLTLGSSEVRVIRVPVKTAIPEIDRIRKTLPLNGTIYIRAYLFCSFLITPRDSRQPILENPLLLSREIEILNLNPSQKMP